MIKESLSRAPSPRQTPATQAAAFAPTATLDRCTRLQNQFGTDDPSSYPTFLPQGGIGGTGPQPEDELFGVMPWEREAFAKVTISPKQLDEAFMGGCQSILDAKLEGYSEEQVKKILDEKGALEVLNMAAKDLDKYFNPPPPKVKKVAKEAGDAPAKKAPAAKKAPPAKKAPAAKKAPPAKKAPRKESSSPEEGRAKYALPGAAA